eukprot:scaffold1149_cov236-Pinguiococcus_pyrenoidosus.AAC.1
MEYHLDHRSEWKGQGVFPPCSIPLVPPAAVPLARFRQPEAPQTNQTRVTPKKNKSALVLLSEMKNAPISLHVRREENLRCRRNYIGGYSGGVDKDTSTAAMSIEFTPIATGQEARFAEPGRLVIGAK